MMRYTCQACRHGQHTLCDGTRNPPLGMLGGSECVCKGECECIETYSCESNGCPFCAERIRGPLEKVLGA